MMVVAAPLTDVDAALNRLLPRSLVIVGTLVLLGLVAWAVVRVGLLPLDRSATPRARSRAATSRTASRRPTRGPRSDGSGSLNAMLDRLEDAFDRGGRARTGCAASSRMRRTSCAPAGIDPRLRRAVPDGRRSAEEWRAMRRIEDEERGWACWSRTR